MRKLSTLWTQNLRSTEARKALEQKILSSYRDATLVRLKEIIDLKLQELNSKEISPAVFDNLNWAYTQAHINGQKQTLTTLADLLEFVEVRQS